MKKQVCYYFQHHAGLEFIHSRNSDISYPLHNHVSTYVIGFLLKGNITLIRENEKTRCAPKTLFIIPPYEPHAIDADTPYDLLTICLHKNALASTHPAELKQLAARYLSEILPANALNKADHHTLENVIDAVFHRHSHFLRKTESRTISRLRARLETHAENRISIKEMAQAAFTSQYHFIRQFRKNAGLTPYRFQIQNRIRKAQKMLPLTRTLTELAYLTGFYDQSHFIRHFKKVLGMTPGEYLDAVHTLPE